MTEDQRLMIAQQMRQHIQLLTQMTLLTSHDPTWKGLQDDCKDMTKELVNTSFSQGYSIFAQDNLFPSLGVVQEWEALSQSPTEIQKTIRGTKYSISPQLMEFMASKTVFIYPQLLPQSAIDPTEDKMVFWSTGEDDLIALRLEDYEKSRTDMKKCQQTCLKNISENLIRKKTVRQIRSRYKNQTKKLLQTKMDSDGGSINSILYYKLYKHAPRNSSFCHLLPYHASQILAPKHVSLSELPPVWNDYVKKLRGEPDMSINITEMVEKKSFQALSKQGRNISHNGHVVPHLQNQFSL